MLFNVCLNPNYYPVIYFDIFVWVLMIKSFVQHNHCTVDLRCPVIELTEVHRNPFMTFKMFMTMILKTSRIMTLKTSMTITVAIFTACTISGKVYKPIQSKCCKSPSEYIYPSKSSKLCCLNIQIYSDTHRYSIEERLGPG